MRLRPNLERLERRDCPTTAFLSNGLLFVQGDAGPFGVGNQLNVSANAAGAITVTDFGLPVNVLGASPTTANVTAITEAAGAGPFNSLATSASVGAIPTSFIGNGTTFCSISPGNNAPSFAVGSPFASCTTVFTSNPGGKDTFIGGAGLNNFVWPPGTGTDAYVGAGRGNSVTIVGNAGSAAEQDSFSPDGTGGVVYSRNNLVPFQLYTRNIQSFVLTPNAALAGGNFVTIGDMSGTPTRSIVIRASNSTVDASAQRNPGTQVVVQGAGDTILPGAGTTFGYGGTGLAYYLDKRLVRGLWF